jgi:hypothetical protein
MTLAGAGWAMAGAAAAAAAAMAAAAASEMMSVRMVSSSGSASVHVLCIGLIWIMTWPGSGPVARKCCGIAPQCFPRLCPGTAGFHHA